MKQLKFIMPALLLLALFTAGADAQKKATRKSSTKKPTATKSGIPPLDVRAAREKAVIQRDNVNFWIDKLGPIAEALELLDAAYARKRPNNTTLATTRRAISRCAAWSMMSRSARGLARDRISASAASTKAGGHLSCSTRPRNR